MTIAIDARIINSTTGRYVERLLYHLEQLDKNNLYLILVRKADINFYKPSNPNFKVVEADFADYSFGEQLGFAKLLYQLKPDLVHFCMPQQPLLYFGTVVTTVHDLNLLRITTNDSMGSIELRIKKLIFRTLLWIVTHRSKRIITPTKYVKNDLIGFAKIVPGKILVTYEGGEIKKEEPVAFGLLANKQFLLYAGRAEPYKNNRRLIEAHQQLLKKYPDIHLAIVGKKDALRQADIAWVEKNQYKQVDFLGFVDDSQLAWLYANCRAYVFPSFMEGFGLPGLEAMAYGAPVVSSNATCLPEVYKNGAHYFDPSDMQAMTKAIDEVISDDILQQKLIANGREVHTKYSWQRMAKQTLAVYESAIKQD